MCKSRKRQHFENTTFFFIGGNHGGRTSARHIGECSLGATHRSPVDNWPAQGETRTHHGHPAAISEAQSQNFGYGGEYPCRGGGRGAYALVELSPCSICRAPCKFLVISFLSPPFALPVSTQEKAFLVYLPCFHVSYIRSIGAQECRGDLLNMRFYMSQIHAQALAHSRQATPAILPRLGPPLLFSWLQYSSLALFSGL